MNPENQRTAAVLIDKRAPATALFCIMMDEFGTEFLDWEPETLEQEVEGRWKTRLPTVNRDKIWALATVLTTNLFYQSLEAFTHICNALNGSEADFENYDPADVAEMCWALAEVTMLNPPEESEGDVFNQEILTYMEERLKYEGFQKVPKILGKYVSLPANEEAVNQVLTQDSIDFNAHWDSQQRKLLEIDRFVSDRLAAMVMLIAELPLQSADPQGVADLKERASRALAKQQQETTQVSQSVSRAPVL